MTPVPITHASLHHAILRAFVDRGHAPSVAELAATFGTTGDVTRHALRALEAYHGVVLHPGSCEVWAAHPFSAAPTAFWVQGAQRGWWGNCAWCSLGVAALVGGDVTISSRSGGESEPVRITVRDGVVEPTTSVIHFPIPMAHAWDNVVYTCSTMLAFSSADAVDAWCGRHAIPKGDVRSVQQVWELARVWYGRHLEPDWVKWTGDEAREIFAHRTIASPWRGSRAECLCCARRATCLQVAPGTDDVWIVTSR